MTVELSGEEADLLMTVIGEVVLSESHPGDKKTLVDIGNKLLAAVIGEQDK